MYNFQQYLIDSINRNQYLQKLTVIIDERTDLWFLEKEIIHILEIDKMPVLSDKERKSVKLDRSGDNIKIAQEAGSDVIINVAGMIQILNNYIEILEANRPKNATQIPDMPVYMATNIRLYQLRQTFLFIEYCYNLRQINIDLFRGIYNIYMKSDPKSDKT